MGVWIETDLYIPLRERIKSHPSWVCGLKHWYAVTYAKPIYVTPFVGVWIETAKKLMHQRNV